MIGTVLDKTTGDPLIQAGVEVVGQGKRIETDMDGHFTVKLPPGTYEFRISAELYQPVRLQGVKVKANEVSKQSVSLAAATANVEVVEVTAKANKAAEAVQLWNGESPPSSARPSAPRPSRRRPTRTSPPS